MIEFKKLSASNGDSYLIYLHEIDHMNGILVSDRAKGVV